MKPETIALHAGYEGDPQPFREKAQRSGIGDVMQFVGRIPHEEFSTALNASDIDSRR